MTEDAEYWERQLNPRLAVADPLSFYGAWPAWAAATRAARPHRTVAYGPHPREAFDVFPAAEPKGAVLFIHGGYWRAFSKDDFSWVADGFVDRGFTTVVLGYPLCPEVGLPDIVASTRRAFAVLVDEVLGAAERAALAVTGHSAGGYLTALLLATDWAAAGIGPDPIRNAVSISGVFDLAPLVHTSMNGAIGLDADAARALSLTAAAPMSRARLTLVVGGEETAEFHRQSEALAAAWATLDPEVVDVAGRNHFDVIEALRRPDGDLVARVLDGLD